MLIAHLRARKETRWHSFNENLDYPDTDKAFEKYVNSRMEDGKIQIILRDIVKEGYYEHTELMKNDVSAAVRCAEVCPGTLIEQQKEKQSCATRKTAGAALPA